MNINNMKKEDFINAIGKTVYRNDDGCSCPECKVILEKGLTIKDKEHAEYLFEIQNEFLFDGVDLNYRLEK